MMSSQTLMEKYTHELDMSSNSKGVYFLEISSEKGTLNSKMVLQ